MGAGHNHGPGSNHTHPVHRYEAPRSQGGGNLVGQIDTFLRRQGSPLAGLGRTFVQAGRRYGVDPRFIVAIAGSETSYGKTGNATGIKNAFGWGPHIRFPSFEANINAVAKGLGGSLYKGSGLNTIGAIGGRWAPVGASNDPTNLNSNWVKNVSRFYSQLGGDPSKPVIGGGRNFQPVSGPATGGQQDAGRAGVGLDGKPLSGTAGQVGATEAQVQLPSYVNTWINRWMERSANDVMAGRDPRSAEPLLRLLAAQQARLQPTRGSVEGGRTIVPGQPQGVAASSSAGAAGQIPNKPNANWAGTEVALRNLLKRAGNDLPITSEKRDRQSTASGGRSDHWAGSKDSYAFDLGATPGPQGDRIASRIVRMLGGPKNWGLKGGNFVTTVNGIRYQVIWRSNVGGNHYDHIHVGARRVA